jgi:hypothetical protein
MLPLAALFVAAYGNPTSFYLKLGNTLQAYLDYEHKISYDEETLAKKMCKTFAQISVPFHDDPAVRENQCFLKCTADPTAPGCASYATHCEGKSVSETKNPECYSGSNVICAEFPDQIEALCNAVEGCDNYGFYEQTVAGNNPSIKYGVLGTDACRTIDGVNAAGQPYTTSGGKSDILKYKTHVKDTYSPEQCPLGLGVEVIGGTSELSSMRGLYEADLSDLVDADSRSPQYYKHVDSDLGNYNYISWHVSGCGWVGLMHDETFLPPTPAPDTCSDDDLLANTLIGQCDDPATCASEDPDYEVDLCQLITTV